MTKTKLVIITMDLWMQSLLKHYDPTLVMTSDGIMMEI